MKPRLDLTLQRPMTTLAAFVCAAAFVTACGGGGDSAATRTSYASGPITGLGSVYVNGVRYDDSMAKVSSEDDDSDLPHDKSELKLGMVVEVEASGSSSDGNGRSAKATKIRFGSEIVGPLDATSINLTNKTFVLLGQTIQVDANTIFDNSLPTELAALVDGMVIEVHGILDAATGIYRATRIEVESSVSAYKLRGAISELDVVAPKTFKIGATLISYADLSPAPMGLANGQIVRVKLATTKNSAGAWVAIKLKSGMRKMEDHDEVEVKGTISGFTGIGNPFMVDGREVIVSSTTKLPSMALAEGDFVEVEGRAEGGKIFAAKIELEDDSSDDSGKFEFNDRIAGLVEATGTSDAETFMVKGMTIRVDGATRFDDGATRANIKNGDCVEVKAAPIEGSADLRATKVEFDNSCKP